MANILIIDDDPYLCLALEKTINKAGHDIDSADTLAGGRLKVLVNSYDIIFLDVKLPDGNGLEMIPQLRYSQTEPEIIVLTGYADMDGAEQAIQFGAWDYVEKGASFKAVMLCLNRALEYRRQKRKSQDPVIIDNNYIIGNSPAMRKSLESLDVVSKDVVHNFPILRLAVDISKRYVAALSCRNLSMARGVLSFPQTSRKPDCRPIPLCLSG